VRRSAFRDQRGQRQPGRVGRDVGHGWVGQQRVVGVEQREVPVAVQGGRVGRAGRRAPAPEEPGDLRRDRPERDLGREGRHGAADPFLLYLEVAGTTQLAGQPAQFGDDAVGAVAVAQGPERLQRAAHPAARHPHAVHAVGGVPADLRVRRTDRVGLLPQVGQHDLACARTLSRGWPRRPPGGSGRRGLCPASTTTRSGAPQRG